MTRPRWVRPLALALGSVTSAAVPALALAQAQPPSGGQLQQQLNLPPPPPNTRNPSLSIQQPSQALATSTTPIPVRLIRISGNTLLPTDKLHALVAQAEGQTLTLGQLQALADRITQYYRAHGYPLARAYVPAQSIADGQVTLAVLEARYGRIELEDPSGVADRPLRQTLSALQSGAPVEESTLDRTLLLASDIPGVIVNSTLRPGTQTGTSDLDVDVGAAPRFTGLLAVDDYGNRYTGAARGTGSLDVNGLLNQGDRLAMNLLTSGGGMDYAQLDYRYWLGGEGTVLGLQASDLYYHLSGSLTPLEAHGTAQVDTLFVSQPLVRTVPGNLYLQVQFDHKGLFDRLDAAQIDAARHTDTGSIVLAGDRRDDGGITNFNLSLALANVAFGNDAARIADQLGVRTQGTDEHYGFTLARLQQLDSSDALYVAVTAQAASKNLDPSDQFYLGGPSNARGYDVGVLTGAQGYLLTGEWRRALPLPAQGSWLASLFVDHGHLQVYKDPVAPGPNAATLTDVGAGLHWNGPHQWQLSVQLAAPVGPASPLLRPSSGARAWAQLQKGF